LNAAQPTGTGSQKVSSRNSSTELTATPPGTPAAVSPAVSAASTAPRPPGVGMIEPIALPVRYTTPIFANGTSLPNAATHAERHKMYVALSSSAPPSPSASLRGCCAMSTSRGST